MEEGVEAGLRPLPQSHLVVQLFVQVADVLLVLAPLLAGHRDASSGRQQVVDEGSVVARLDALLIFGAQLLLLLGNVLPCDVRSSVRSFAHPSVRETHVDLTSHLKTQKQNETKMFVLCCCVCIPPFLTSTI